MNAQELKTFVEENPKLVSKKVAGDGIYVLKYKRRVFYDKLWNEFLEECRGTIVDEDFNVIARPFTKIYNFRIEDKSPVLSDDTSITAYRKVNGFLCNLTWYNNDILVSTTGSTDSSHVTMAKEMMLKEQSWNNWVSATSMNRGYTMMFECVHPEDPHIIPEETGMYFLGWRENTWDSKVNGHGAKIAKHWREFAIGLLRCKYAESFETTVGELVELSKTVLHEGFVFYTADGVAAKIKSPHYLISKFVARNPNTDKLMNPQIKQTIDEEYYPLIDHIQANIVEFTAMGEQARLTWVREFLESEWHTCPFKEEIHGDSESMCQCTSEETQQCADDI
jgi:hypothetical protein